MAGNNVSNNPIIAKIEAAGKKWKAIQYLGLAAVVAGILMFVFLQFLGLQSRPILLDVSIWLLLGGFVLYVVGRVGSW